MGALTPNIASATDSTATPWQPVTRARTIKVRVAFTDRGGYTETRTSAATEAVSFAVQQQQANSVATGQAEHHRHGPGGGDAGGAYLGHWGR